MIKTRQVIGLYDESADESELESNSLLQVSVKRVQIRQYPYIGTFNAVHKFTLQYTCIAVQPET